MRYSFLLDYYEMPIIERITFTNNIAHVPNLHFYQRDLIAN
jgi:hypothetical protein